jgi:hypothetical protein
VDGTRWGSALVALVATSLLASCGGAVTDSYTIEHQPAVAETIPGSDQVRVTVEQAAAERLRIRTAPVTRATGGLVVPSAAVFVDPEGAWWVYTNPKPFVFVREEISVKREDDGKAYLSSGPPVGSKVVTRGAPELYGVENESGH